MPVPANSVLDGPLSVGQIQSTVRWSVVDRQLDPIGDIRPLDAGSVDASTSAAVKRKLSGVRISERDLQDLNPFRDMLAPFWVLGDGTEWPLGVFAFTDLPRQVSTGMSTLNATMLDQSWLFAQQAGRTYTIAPGGTWRQVIVDLLDSCAINPRNRVMPDNDTTSPEGVAWPPETAKQRILDECAAAMGCLPAYFDNAGVFTLRTWPDFRRLTADCAYRTEDGRMIEGSLVTNENNMNAPNVYRVIGSGIASASLFGEARVAADLPWSVEQRGVEVVEVIPMQGLASSSQARFIAETRAAEQSSFAEFTFDSFPDPRHDLFMTVNVDGVLWRELGWSLRLGPGGPMRHSLTRGGFPAPG